MTDAPEPVAGPPDGAVAAPLHGMSVVEMASNIAGPHAGAVLSQLGAEVTKIERPEGDDARGWGPPFSGSTSAVFAAMNAGKRSLVLDLRRPDERATLLSLLDGTDVLITSWRPGALTKLELDLHTDIRPGRPGLITCNLSGFGAVGPRSQEPGYDPVIQAFSGLMSTTGHPDHPPARLGPSIVDLGTGVWAALAVVVSLLERASTGRGGHIETSLLEGGLAWMPNQVLTAVEQGRDPGRWGSGMPSLVPYQTFETSDGKHLMVAVGNDRLWRRLCDVLVLDELASDPSLDGNAGRVAKREAVVSAIQERIRCERLETWTELLTSSSVPHAEVRTLTEALDDEQVRSLGLMTDVDRPGARTQPVLGLPFTVDGVRPRPRRAAPDLGDANDPTEVDAPTTPSTSHDE